MMTLEQYHTVFNKAATAFACIEHVPTSEGHNSSFRIQFANKAFWQEFNAGTANNGLLPETLFPDLPWSTITSSSLASNDATVQRITYNLRVYRAEYYVIEDNMWGLLLTDITTQCRGAEYIQNLFSLNLDLLSIADTEGNFIMLNNQWQEVLGYSPDEIRSQPYIDFIHPDDKDRTIATAKEVIANGEVTNFSNRYRCKNGEYRLLQWRSIYNNGIIYSTARDITAQQATNLSLEESNSEFSSILNIQHEMICRFRPDSTLVYVNDAYCSTFGTTREQLLGTQFIELVPTDERSVIYENIAKVQQTKTVTTYDHKVLLPNGNFAWHRWSDYPVVDSEGNVPLIQSVGYDITEQKNAELALRGSEEKLRVLFDTMPVGITIAGESGHIIQSNKAAEHILGLTPEQQAQRDIDGTEWRIIRPDGSLMPPEEYASVRALKEQKPILNVEMGVFRGKNDIAWILVNAAPVEGLGVVISYLDFTELKNAEQQLRNSEARFRAYIENAPNGIFVANAQGNYTSVNQAAVTLTRYTEEQLLTKNIMDIVSREGRELALEAFRSIQENMQAHVELPILFGDDSKGWIALSACKVDDNNNIAFVTDITERRLQERQLRESEERFRQIADNTNDVFWLREYPNGRLLYINNAFRNIWDSDIEAVYQNPDIFFQRIHPEDREAVQLLRLNSPEEHSASITCRLLSADNVIRWIAIKIFAIYDDNGVIIRTAGFATDITTTYLAQQQVQYLNYMQELLMRIASNFINLPLDKTDQAIQTSLADLGGFVGADRAYVFLYNWQSDTSSNTHEWCAPNIQPQIEELQNVPNDFIPDWIAMHKQGKAMNIPNVQEMPPNNPVRLILEPQHIKSLIAIPMMHKSGCLGFVGFDSVQQYHVYSDKEQMLLTLFAEMLVSIQNKRAIEQQLLSSITAAETASKAKSEFLANMSHEIRTPLNGVIGFTDLMLKTTLAETQRQYAEYIYTSGKALLGIVNDILDFSKIEAGRLQLDIISADIYDLVAESADIVKYLAYQKGLEFIVDIPPDMPQQAKVDPVRLRQVLINLLNNSIKFTHKGEVEIRVKYKMIDAEICEYTFYVRDTGIGIGQEQLHNLFQAFVQGDASTTRRFGGTGLGLTISAHLVAKMGGKIDVESTVGKGTTFWFSVQCACTKIQPLQPTTLDLSNVLIVDDVAANRLILQQYLSFWGVNTVNCPSGLEAVQKLTSNAGIDAILLDHHMPYFDGLQTATVIRRTLPEPIKSTPIILIHSSMDSPVLTAQCEELNIYTRLTKPVKARELFLALEKLSDTGKDPAHDRDMEQFSHNSTSSSQTPTHPITILIAEDIPMNMMLVKIIINTMFPLAHIIEAVNGKEAVAFASLHSPDIILMDIHMPLMDGLQATHAIRDEEHIHNKPRKTIIALTAGAVKEEQLRCKDAGMDDFLTKPIDESALRLMMKTYLADKLHS